MRISNNKILLSLLIMTLIVTGIWLLTRPAKTKPTHAPTVPVRVIQVVQRDVPRYVSAIGAVLSLHSVMIRPQIDGILTQLLVKEGQSVKAGDLLATLDDRSIQASLDQANAQLGQNQAQLQVAQIDLKRYQLLSVDNGISKQTLDQQQALVNQLKATARGNQAAIAAAKVQLSYTHIHSPVTGRVGIRAVDPGNFLRVSDAQGLFSVTQIDPIAVEFSLPQQQLPTLHNLLEAKTPALVKAFIGDSEHSITPLGEGRLSLIDNQVSATTGTIKVKAQFNEAGSALFPNQFVNARLQADTLSQVPVVPTRAIQHGSKGDFVFVVTGNKASLRTIKSGPAMGDVTAVLDAGVKSGEQVITEGADKLDDGSAVKVVAQ